MGNWKIYYNENCSKCRSALKILEEKGSSPEIVHYLEQHLTFEDLEKLFAKLEGSCAEWVRLPSEFCGDLDVNDPIQVCRAIAANPSWLQRPIIETESMAIVARPPEKVLGLFVD